MDIVVSSTCHLTLEEDDAKIIQICLDFTSTLLMNDDPTAAEWFGDQGINYPTGCSRSTVMAKRLADALHTKTHRELRQGSNESG